MSKKRVPLKIGDRVSLNPNDVGVVLEVMDNDEIYVEYPIRAVYHRDNIRKLPNPSRDPETGRFVSKEVENYTISVKWDSVPKSNCRCCSRPYPLRF